MAKIADAARRVVDAAVGELPRHMTTPDEIANEISGDRGTHKLVVQSKLVAHKGTYTRLKDYFKEQLTVFAQARSDLPSDWVQLAGEAASERVEGAINALLAERFAKVYIQGREIAVRLQQVSLDTRPSVDEIEQVAGDPSRFAEHRPDQVSRMAEREGKTLRQRYVELARGDQTLLEENERTLEQLVLNEVQRGLTEYYHQLRLVRDHSGGGVPERGALEAELLGALTSLAEAQGMGGYGVFPSALKRVAKRAERLEVRLFERFVTAQLHATGAGGGCKALPKQRINRRVPVLPEQLPEMEREHLGMLTRELEPTVRNELTDRWVVETGSTVAPDFGTRLAAMITNGELSNEFAKHLADCLHPVVRDLRKERAAEELRTKHPTIENRTFQFPDEAFVQLAKGDEFGRGRHFPGQRGLHLEETGRRFEKRRDDLVAEARRAFDRQMSLVESRKEVYEAHVADTKERTDMTLQALFKQYVSEVTRAWNDQRPQLLDIASDRYFYLFLPVKARIMEILKLEWQRPVAPIIPENQLIEVEDKKMQQKAPSGETPGAKREASGRSGPEGQFSGKGEGGPGNGKPNKDAGGVPGGGDGTSCESALAALQRCPVALIGCSDALRGCTQALAACRTCVQGLGLCIWGKGDCLAAIEICDEAQRACK
ncbi:MAG: hypothetical protein AB2809_07435 [Candidatus Thiodiazotropha sp.]